MIIFQFVTKVGIQFSKHYIWKFEINIEIIIFSLHCIVICITKSNANMKIKIIKLNNEIRIVKNGVIVLVHV